jgi:hypothetical protein
MDDAATLPKLDARLREFQRFGVDGPIYQVLGVSAPQEMVRVRVLKSGEEFDYRLADAKTDPPA